MLNPIVHGRQQMEEVRSSGYEANAIEPDLIDRNYYSGGENGDGGHLS